MQIINDELLVIKESMEMRRRSVIEFAGGILVLKI